MFRILFTVLLPYILYLLFCLNSGNVKLKKNTIIRSACLSKWQSNYFATGNDSGLLQLWNINKENQKALNIKREPGEKVAVHSFSTLKSITALTFDNNNNNQKLVVGNITGVIKLFDLKEGKLVRNYCGHRSSISDIQLFDCYSKTVETCYLASASLDCNLKLWDIRSKQCITTFKTHDATVNCCSFSPNGEWIVSADDAGHTKIWDIKTRKCIHEFHDKCAIHSCIFHPKEMVLATAAGKIVRFWDLDTKEHLCRTNKVTKDVKHIIFAEMEIDTCAKTLLSATEDSLRLWKWDPLPVNSLCNFEVHWSTIQDMSQVHGHNDVLCLETNANNAVVWHIDLGKVNALKKKQESDVNNTEKSEEISDEDEEYAEDFEEEIECFYSPVEISITTKLETKDISILNEKKEEEEDVIIHIPEGLKHLSCEKWTQSFVDAAEKVRIIRKQKSKFTKIDTISETNENLQKFNEGHNDVLQKANTKKLKFAHFIPVQYKHVLYVYMSVILSVYFAIQEKLIDFDDRALIKIKRSFMNDHRPSLKFLAYRLRLLRKLKCFWKKRQLQPFIHMLQLEQDFQCQISIIVHFLQSILKPSLKSKSFSLKFCFEISHLINDYLLNTFVTDSDSESKKCEQKLFKNAEHIGIQFVCETIEMFSTFIVQTLNIEIEDKNNLKNISIEDRKELCLKSYELFSNEIKAKIEQKISNFILIEEESNKGICNTQTNHRIEIHRHYLTLIQDMQASLSNSTNEQM